MPGMHTSTQRKKARVCCPDGHRCPEGSTKMCVALQQQRDGSLPNIRMARPGRSHREPEGPEFATRVPALSYRGVPRRRAGPGLACPAHLLRSLAVRSRTHTRGTHEPVPDSRRHEGTRLNAAGDRGRHSIQTKRARMPSLGFHTGSRSAHARTLCTVRSPQDGVRACGQCQFTVRFYLRINARTFLLAESLSGLWSRWHAPALLMSRRRSPRSLRDFARTNFGIPSVLADQRPRRFSPRLALLIFSDFYIIIVILHNFDFSRKIS